MGCGVATRVGILIFGDFGDFLYFGDLFLGWDPGRFHFGFRFRPDRLPERLPELLRESLPNDARCRRRRQLLPELLPELLLELLPDRDPERDRVWCFPFRFGDLMSNMTHMLLFIVSQNRVKYSLLNLIYHFKRDTALDKL